MKEAKCRKTNYCSFHDIVEMPDAFVEECTTCSRRLIWKKDKHGRIDNRAYLRFHVRDFAQANGPTGKVFAEIYGEKAYKRALNSKSSKNTQWDRAGDEALAMLKELKKEKSIV